MSLIVKSYKLVSREYFENILRGKRKTILLKERLKAIKRQLIKNKFFTDNKEIEWWIISYDSNNIQIAPADDF